MYSTLNIDAPARNSMVAPLVGAAVGAVVGVACYATASAIAPSNLYAASAVRPAVSTMAVPVSAQNFQVRQAAGAQYAAPVTSFAAEESAQNTAVYGWAFGLFATVAGAVNGIFLWKNRQAAMAATTGRREALMAGAAAAGFAAAPAFAAYGEGANVFGKPKETLQSQVISGNGWQGTLPGKYNASKEIEAAGQVGRWEDNFDALNNSLVVELPVGKNSITEVGTLDDVRKTYVAPLLGKTNTNPQLGASISEGGFAPGTFANASLLDQKQETKDGKVYYVYELLTRTADGTEGGRHQLFKLAVSNGKLILLKAQGGDKRWFTGTERLVRKSFEEFRVL